MKGTIILTSAFGLLLGCQPGDRAARHEEKAADQRAEAHKELVKGREEASKDLEQAREKADKDIAKASEQEQKADESRAKDEGRADMDDQRAPVAGREEGIMVRDSLKDKLGDDWTVEKSGDGWMAMRKNASKADKDLKKRLNDEMKKVRDDQKNVTASYTKGEVILRGQVEDCDDVGKTADKFAKIDGVNKIKTEMSCVKK